MRIVLINWARISEGAARGGGVNGYCRAVALELVARGHEVVSLCGGTTFEAGPGSREPGPCSLRRHEDWRGIRVFEVINSPVLAPALPQFREPLGEVSSASLESLVATLLGEVRPDAVHVHSLEGFTAGCIAAIRRGAPGARIVFSLHNYHTICPQVYLMQGHRRPCSNFDNGQACDGCIPSVDPAAERARLACGSDLAPEFEWKRREPSKKGGGWKATLAAVLKGRTAGAAAQAPPSGNQPPLWSEAWITMPAHRPLSNAVLPEPPSSQAPNEYGVRRRAMVEALNQCDAVLAVSEFVGAKFRSLGVADARLRTLHIGTAMRDTSAARRPEPDSQPSAPAACAIRLAFVGYHNWYKGLPMLVESLELLTPEVLGRFHLTVLALGGEEMEPALRALEPRLAGLDLAFGYAHEDLPTLLAGVDLGLVTSVWWDNGPQTVLEFLACGVPVLGAELGGIPDFIQEGINGLLFRGNDRWDLARCLARLSRDAAIPGRLRAGVRPPKGIREHVGELEAVYSDRVC